MDVLQYESPKKHATASGLKKQRASIARESTRLDCLEIMTCLFKEGYFTRSGRLQRKTIQNLQDDGKISVQDLPKLIDLLLTARCKASRGKWRSSIPRS